MSTTPPIPTGTEALVCADIATRQLHGIQKYGQTVAENPLLLPAWIQHAYEEALDLAVYLKRSLKEADRLIEIERAERMHAGAWQASDSRRAEAVARAEAAEALCAELRDTGLSFSRIVADTEISTDRVGVVTDSLSAFADALAKTPATVGKELAELREDKARLDWMLRQQSGGTITLRGIAMTEWCNGADWRNAIDAARKQGGQSYP